MDFKWAQNKIKLQFAINDLKQARLANPTIEINEATVLKRYIERAGVVDNSIETPEITKEPLNLEKEVLIKQPTNSLPTVKKVVVRRKNR